MRKKFPDLPLCSKLRILTAGTAEKVITAALTGFFINCPVRTVGSGRGVKVWAASVSGLAVYEDGGDEAHSYLPTLLRYLVCGSCELWKLCEFCRSRIVVAGGFPRLLK